MISPARLLEHAKDFLQHGHGAPNQTDLRRAVSSGYYALFHRLLAATADQLVGASPQQRKRAEYRLVYRSLQHSLMSDSCEAITKQTLSAKIQQATGLTHFGADIRRCALAFVELQEQRHSADYDPSRRFTKLEASTLISTAEDAIKAFEAAPAAERRALVYVLAFKARE